MLSGLKLRPAQAAILEYTQGWMGISAVPGSGKTYTLSALAATLLVEERLNPDQEVLIVTLVNSAVRNFSQRIATFMQGQGLLPDIGYRVRTLHSLASDILRERPDLAGLSDHFQIVDENESNRILDDVSSAWLSAHPQFFAEYLNPDEDERKARHKFPELVSSIARAFIGIAKDEQVTPAELSRQMNDLAHPNLLLQMGCEIYTDYQRALAYRSSVDFDDLIRLALQCLRSDPLYLHRLRYRWPFILEDEAQDSSRLQEEILKLLAGPEGNWVRVGDPNQAIYETFTTANPHYLIDFRKMPGVTSESLPNSGRSMASIIKLANYLIEWTNYQHPHEELRDALTPPLIRETPPDDPQPNPADQPENIYLSHLKLTAEKEVSTVVKSAKNWVMEHPEQTVAILTPRNDRGVEMVNTLKAEKVPYLELLKSSQSTRQTADLLANILRFLADPAHTGKLLSVYQSIRRDQLEQKEQAPLVHQVEKLLRSCAYPENYLAPTAEQDWLLELTETQAPPPVRGELEMLRVQLLPWLKAAALPVDQLLLTIAQDLFSRPADLALAHKMALVLESMAQNHPDWHLPEFADELAQVANNERKFFGFSDEDTGFDPDLYKGKVVVATIHKAKGLEWDRVYLTSVNNYDFPSLDSIDNYIGEKWFVRGKLNLQAEAVSLLKGLIKNDPSLLELEEGEATRESRQEYAAERLRLLFVGITRARTALTVTWNTGRRGDCTAAYPLLELERFWEEQK